MKKWWGLMCVLALASKQGIAQPNTLDYYLTYATSNSPLIRDLQNQMLSFSLDSQIVRATLRPQVTGISNDLYAPTIHGFGYDETITNKALVSALVQVNKSILPRRSIAAQIASFSIQSQSAGNNLRITQQDLRKTITDQYIVTFGEQLQLEISREITDLLKNEDSLLKKLTQNNVYKQSDYLAFRVTLEQQLLATSELEIQYNYDYASLNYLAGLVDSSTTAGSTRLQDPQLKLLVIPDYKTSIFYRQYVLDSLKLRNDRALIDINYRPKINVFGDAGYNSTLQFQPYKNWGVSFGLNLSIPIYDGGQRKLQYAKIDLQEKTRQAKRDYYMRQQEQQIYQLRIQLASTEKLIEQINKQITYTRTLIEVNQKLLATGDIRLTDFIISLNNYLNSRNLVAQNYVNRLKIINQLNYWGIK